MMTNEVDLCTLHKSPSFHLLLQSRGELGQGATPNLAVQTY